MTYLTNRVYLEQKGILAQLGKKRENRSRRWSETLALFFKWTWSMGTLMINNREKMRRGEERKECCQSALFALFTAENEWSITRHYYQRNKRNGCFFEAKNIDLWYVQSKILDNVIQSKNPICVACLSWSSIFDGPGLVRNWHLAASQTTRRERKREKVLILSDWSNEIGRKRKIATGARRDICI